MAGLTGCCAGEVPDALYMIRHGEVEVKGRQSIKVILGRGQIFGEMALMGLTPDGRRIRTASGLTHCEFCVLSREDFEELIRTDVRVCRVLRQTVMSHITQLRMAARVVSTHQGSQGDLESASSFYERLCFVDWHQTLDEMRIRRKEAKARFENAQFSDAKVTALERASNCKAIRTLLKIQFGSLTTHDHSILNDMKGFCQIFVSWEDKLHGASSGNQSEEFLFERESSDVIGVRQNVDIPLVHVERLKDLSPVKIRLCLLSHGHATPSNQRWTPGMKRSETLNTRQKFFDQDSSRSLSQAETSTAKMGSRADLFHRAANIVKAGIECSCAMFLQFKLVTSRLVSNMSHHSESC